MKRILLAAALLCASCSAALAVLSVPTGPVVLTVRGHVANPNVDGTAQFDMAMLEALAGRQAVMETPWTDGKAGFSGPLLRAVLAAAGAEGETLIVRALNDYAAEIPFADAQTLDTILAVRMNGEYMSVRDKGPIFLIYPFDLDRSLYSEKYFSRSVWQISEIEVVD